MEPEKQGAYSNTKRFSILYAGVFLLFVTIILRLAYIQIIQGDQYQDELTKNSVREILIPAPRGKILDRNGVELVTNQPIFTVIYSKKQGNDIDEEEIAHKLANLLTPQVSKLGSDKDFLQLYSEAHAQFPIEIGAEEKKRVRQTIYERLSKLPSTKDLDTLNDKEILTIAQSVRMQVNPYVDSNGFIQQDKREKLLKEMKYIVNQLPSPDQLKSIADYELLRLAVQFAIDVKLSLTDKKRQEYWTIVEILKEMQGKNIPDYIPRVVKRNITREDMYRIEERLSELPGIKVEVEATRKIRKDFDESPIATYILGYLTSIRPDELNTYLAEGYSPNDKVGETGLEEYYETTLRGKNGKIRVQVNKNAQAVEQTIVTLPQSGNDLVLSIDLRFQSKVEQILKEAVEIAKQKESTKGVSDAHAVVMDPRTGEVLAMASYPDYDLNLYYDRKQFSTDYETEILPNELNKLINASYAPGSTVKPISVMLSLQEKISTPSETIFDRGYWIVGDRQKWNWNRSGHGAVNAKRAIQVSNNTYMYAMAMRLADRGYKLFGDYKPEFETIRKYSKQFGLGVKTGIDLPNEIAGRESKYSYLGNMADAFIGQYDQFTPVQLCQYVSTIANGGYRLRPHIVKEIRKSTTNPNMPYQHLQINEPEVINKIQIDKEWLKLVQEGMSLVTKPGGTASVTFKGLPFQVAAKTGTAQTNSDADNSLIIAYAPYERPQIALAVIVPKGGHGSDASGPIAKKILEEYNQLYPLDANH